MHLTLIGFPRSGKTTIGKQIASWYGMQFLDTDELLVTKFHKKHGNLCSTSEIHRQIGESSFRELEQEVIQDLAPSKQTVIATGGGALLRRENAVQLKQFSRLIYLQVEEKIIKKRLLAPPLPSFINHEKDIEQLISSRKSIYESSADYILPIHGGV